MANAEHLAILEQGVKVWNQWREENPKARPDLREIRLYGKDLSNVNLNATYLFGAYLMGVKLSGADLRWVQLLEAKLNGANLNGSKLSYADLSGADLSWTKFCGADLEGAGIIRSDLTAADLREANLRKANLRNSDFTGADLSGVFLNGAKLGETIFNKAILNQANLSGARIGQSVFTDVDLSKVKGLQNVHHYGPSSLGIDTIHRSAGNIPEEYLRGVGVPEQFIDFSKSLVETQTEYYSVFISHSHVDEAFASKLQSELRDKEIRVWYFPEDARMGKSVWGEIDLGVQSYDKLVLVCSENSLQSGPVLRELERTLNREDKEGKSILFPIQIDNYIFDEWEHERKTDVTSKVVGNFCDWGTDADKYASAFERLLEGLQAEE